MTHLLELLLGELRLERLHEASGGLPRRVGDDVQLDRHVSRLIGSEGADLAAPFQGGPAARLGRPVDTLASPRRS
jgi:hypothetical protein